MASQTSVALAVAAAGESPRKQQGSTQGRTSLRTDSYRQTLALSRRRPFHISARSETAEMPPDEWLRRDPLSTSGEG